MKFLMTLTIPNEPFNSYVREGRAGQIIGELLETTKPENVFFTSINGQRGALMVVNVNDPSEIPGLAEPYYLTFNSTINIDIAMTPDDLQRSNFNEIGDRWK